MCISNKQAFELVITLKRFYHQYGLGHVVLLVSYVFFLLTFASAFFIIESTNSNAYYSQWRGSVEVERQKFVTNDLLPEIFNNTRILVFIHDHKSQYLNKLMQEQLSYYEHRIKLKPPMPILKCTFTNSFLFSFSTIMTIGYGSIYPVTTKGRIISVLFSLMGIPYTIVVIKDIEYLLVKLLSYPCVILVQLWHMFRYCTLQAVSEDETESKMTSSKMKPRSDYRISTAERLMLMPAMVAVLALVGWFSIGCVIGYLYMPHVNNNVLIYFIFNSLATIGVGDIDLGSDDAVEEIREVYGHDSIGRMTVFRWLKKFRNGDKNVDDLEDDPRSGRPSKFNDDELQRLVEEDDKTTIRDLAARLGFSVGTIHHHLHKLGFVSFSVVFKFFQVSKLGRWVPHLLSEQNKESRMQTTTEFLDRYEQGRLPLESILTGDEKWCLYVNVVRRRSWVQKGETPSQTAKPGLHPKKCLLILFWARGIADLPRRWLLTQEYEDQPFIVFILFVYVLVGLAIVSLFINLLHTKFSRAYWLPGQMYLPLPHQTIGNIAHVDSFDDEIYNAYAEPPIYRYTTLGIFQAEDRCPLIHEIRKETAKIDASTQTQPADRIYYQRPISPQGLYVKQPTSSRDDVNSLIVETYGSKPARLITSSEKRPLSMA